MRGWTLQEIYQLIVDHGGWLGSNSGSPLVQAALKYPQYFSVQYGSLSLAAIYLKSSFKGYDS